MGKHYPIFEENEIDYEVFLGLTEDDLRALNLPLGPQKKIAAEIERLSKAAATTMRGNS